MKRQTRNWNKNLKALQDINPELATKLIELKEECDWIIPIKSQNGNLNILVKRGGGEFLPGYSMENPSKEGDDAAKTMLLYKQNISVVVGMGVGYLVNSILKKSEKEHRIVVVEPVLPMVKIALHNFDFFNAIMKKELIIVTSADQVVLVLQILAGQLMIEGWNMTTDKYTTNRPEEYNKLITITAESLNQILCNTGTIAGAAGGIIADNDISCLPYVIRHRGVEELKGLFRDKPAILVSTGPSLSRNIHHLIDIKDRVIIIAVGQALRVLLAYNIRPDFISTVDFGEVNIGHFKGLMGSGVPLTTINRTYAPLLKEWQGPKFIAATPVPGFEEMASGILTKKGFIEAGGSVAHMCLGLAQLLECNPVIFIGQDLALGENSHIPLADAMGKVGITEDGQIIWKVEDHRCTLHGEKAHSMGPVHTVPGYWGKPVLTNLGLASFLTVFESMIERHCLEDKKIIINSTEGGARIKGALQIPFREAIAKYCQAPIDKSKLTPLLTLADDGDDLVKKVIPLLEQDIQNLKNIVENSRKGMAANRGITVLMKRTSKLKNRKSLITKDHEKLFDKLSKESSLESKGDFILANHLFYEKLLSSLLIKGKLLRALIKLSKINFIFSEAAHISSAHNPLVNVAIYGASRSIQSRRLKVDETLAKFLKDRKIAETRMERNNLILSTAKKASESLLKSYEETLDLLKQYNKTKDDSLLRPTQEEKINLDDAEEYFAVGNWAHPIVDAKKIVDRIDLRFTPEHKKALEIYTKAYEIRVEAIKKAKKHEEEYGEKESNLLQHNNLLEKSQEAGKKGDFKEALILIQKAIELIPDSKDAQWGLATCLNHLKRYDESILEYQKLINNFQIENQPENPRYRFEMGQVMLLADRVKEGLKEISKAMETTNEFNSFFAHLGDIYMGLKMYKEAEIAYSSYLESFPINYVVWEQHAKCLMHLGQKKKAEVSYQKARRIKKD